MQGSRGDNWMSFIPDDKPLTAMSIPGTHDTVTYDKVENSGWNIIGAGVVGGPWIQCQDINLGVQLLEGIRFFDIRCKVGDHYMENMGLGHGAFTVNIGFNEVLDNFQEFLRWHPTETILMSLKQEDDTTDGVHESFAYQRDRRGGLFYDDWGGPNVMPTVGEVRGRLS
jgi:1-phosphatidylinositol phosphodiesterase